MKTRLEIFKAGTHTAMDGRKYTFSNDDVAQMAAVYDPTLSEAPHVIGHPKVEDPAYGWASALTAENGVLFADSDQIDPAFADMVTAGRFKKRSIKVWGPKDPGNPKPGGYYLKHIGWLGATPPAVKGLGAAFSEGADDAGIEFAEGEVRGFWIKELFQGFRDWLIEDKGLEVADKVLPRYAIDNIERPDDKPMFSEGDADTLAGGDGNDTVPAGQADDQVVAFAERQAELDAREAAIAAREKAAADQAATDQLAFAAAEIERQVGEHNSFVDSLVSAGTLPPGFAKDTKTVFGVLAGDTSISFAEGEADAPAKLRTLLGALGKAIHFGEVAPGLGVAFAERQTAEHHTAAIRAVMDEAAAAGRPITAAEAASIARNR